MKVVVTGPESSGKTTLCASLSKHFMIDYVPELAREYLQKQKGIYNEIDLVEIAKGQIALENKFIYLDQKLLICDTSLEVIRIWSEWKFNNCHPYILEQAKSRRPDLFLLLKPDIPWQPDSLRENSEDREELFNYYQKSLLAYDTEVIEIGGNRSQRLQSAIEAIDKLKSV